MRPPHVADARGNALSLGRELGRGGEGAVYEVDGRPGYVAKVYLKRPSPQHAAKLAALAAMASSSLLKTAALPTETLHESDGRLTGFLMPKVSGHKAIFKLYSPKSRLQEFPTADWRFLIQAARNTARAFSTVHASGLVVGDVNHGNLVVANDATVQIIDCDSFQVSSKGKTFFCTVGVGTHQPPEMQRQASYAGIIRTPDYDRFGLAVIIFQLLCMNRHPFSGRFLGKGDPPTIEDAIASSRYVYSRDHRRTQMEVPPGSLPIGALTSEIQDLFEEAFSPAATRSGRPDGERWVAALDALASDLKSCGANRAHYYRRALGTCPWCAIEAASGATLFPVVFLPNAAGAGIGMAALWQEVGKVLEPPPLDPWPPAPARASRLSPEARKARRRAVALNVCGWGSVIAALAAALWISSPHARALLVPAIGVIAFVINRHRRKTRSGRFQARLSAVEQDWEALRAAWRGLQADRNFSDLRAALSSTKASFDALPEERVRRLEKLHGQQRDKQLEEHLDRFFLATAKVAGIGPAKVAALASHGIDTAGDIVDAKILAVPGFGEVTLAKLKAWRRGHEQSFRFDAKRGVSASDTALVDRDITLRRAKLEQEMKTGVDRLKTTASIITTQRRATHGRVTEIELKYAQALADVAIASDDGGAAVHLMVMSGIATLVAFMSGASVRVAPPALSVPIQDTASTSSSSSGVPSTTPWAPPLSTAPPPATIALALPPAVGTQAAPSSLPARGAGTSPGYSGDRVRITLPANVRAAAVSSASIVRVAPGGAILRVYARDHGWLQVGDNQPWGWVFSGLAEELH